MAPALTHDEFTQQANTTFQAQTDEHGEISLDLIEVSDVKLHPKQEEFSIVFRGPLNAFLGQGLRSMSHREMGEFELFLVPIREEAEGFCYEAVFNRFREQVS